MSSALWITEDDVVALLDLPASTDALRRGLPALGRNRAATLPETGGPSPDGTVVLVDGGWLAEAPGGEPVMGVSTTVTAGGAAPLLTLWSATDGRLLAVVEAAALRSLRLAATAAVATAALAPTGVTVGALIGTGRQALGQAAAIAAAIPLDVLRVHSPDADRRAAFAQRARAAGLPSLVEDSSSVAEAVDGAGVITLVTRASEPVLHAPMVTADAHVNALGAVSSERAEVAPDLVAACGLVVADDPTAARRQSRRELDDVDEIVPLAEILAAEGGARPPDTDLTLFKAAGLGVSDVILGCEVLLLARAAGRGRPLPDRLSAEPRWVRRPDR